MTAERPIMRSAETWVRELLFGDVDFDLHDKSDSFIQRMKVTDWEKFISSIQQDAIASQRAEPQAVAGWQPMETAPRDGSSVLLFTTDKGQVEAWYAKAEGGYDHEGIYDGTGPSWVCADDTWQIEVEAHDGQFWDGTAKAWMPLHRLPEPKPPEDKA